MTSKKTILYILLLVLGFSAGYFLKPTTKEVIPNVTSSPIKPLRFFTTVDTPKGTFYMVITQDYINLNVAETPYFPNARIIERESYPKLFKQGIASSSALRVEYYKESKNGEAYLKLSNIQPDHGGFADTYAILVDPFTGVIKESKSIDNYSGKASS